MNTDILGISELRWTGMGEFNSYDHYIYYCGQESLRRNGVAIMVNKRVRNAVLGCNLKNDRMISVPFQDKPFSITVIQVCAVDADEAEQFYEDLRDLLELTPQKRCPFHHRGLECKSRKSGNTWFSSVQLLSHVRLFATPWAATHKASLSITNSWSLLQLMSIESVMPSNHLILSRPLLPLSIFPSIRVFSNESVLHIRWPKY